MQKLVLTPSSSIQDLPTVILFTEKKNKFKNILQPFEKEQVIMKDKKAGSWQNFKKTFTKCL